MRQAANMKKKSHQSIDKRTAMETIRTMLPEKIANFVEMQIELHTKANDVHGKRYSEETKVFALSLYHISGKAYRLISKLFYLPSKASLLRWVSRLPNKPGLNAEALGVIEKKVNTMSEASRLCTIALDEISIKANLYYDSKKDEIIGLEDDGDEKTDLVATSALVFMVHGVTENWKQPIAYYFSNEAYDSGKVKKQLIEVLDKMESIGLKVVAVISDLGSNFQRFISELGITPTQPWFLHKGVKIFYLFDPPHIIKAIRNNLINYNFHFLGKVASWTDVKTVYDHDSKLSIRLCPKLTYQHMHPNGFQKMKVRFATQALSHTVAAAIETHVCLGSLPSSACGTAELVSKLDRTFDSLNSSTLNSPKLFRRPITSNSPHLKFLQEMLELIPKIKVINKATNKDVTNTLKCLNALRVTINGTLALWNQLQTKDGLKFLYTRRLNQDCLENFFGSILQQGGNAENPTPVQFCTAFRKLFYKTILQQSSGNCAEDVDKILVPLKSAAENKKTTAEEPQPTSEPFVFEESDFRELNISDDAIGANAITYVAGYLAAKALKKHQCSACKASLVNPNLDSSSKLFCFFKGYESNTKTFGGLTVPNDKFIAYVAQIEDKIIQFFPEVMRCKGVAKDLIGKLPLYQVEECGQFPSEYTLKLYIRLRIYYIIKFGNRNISSGKRKNRKYFKVQHL
jgi:hypothetical protein